MGTLINISFGEAVENTTLLNTTWDMRIFMVLSAFFCICVMLGVVTTAFSGEPIKVKRGPLIPVAFMAVFLLICPALEGNISIIGKAIRLAINA
jgi:hypothetical protein